MDKTVVVRVDRLYRHRLYRKVIKATKKYKAHDEENACGIGDIVRISESRPISRDKRWVVQEILEKAG
jgi:small subunit ribosomal protein S17